mmetsp:Transcript_66084/g.167504  ORF Transcript_66084/g.167504 Transcript_66084/m.167504 type:complete len:453 (+) Transcript_66084:54-1412(+)
MTASTAAADNGIAAAGVDMPASKAENGSAAAAGTQAEAQSAEVRQVRLPAGWEGLSFKLDPVGRLIVSEVPKACFSSAAFGAGAKPQVAGVAEGDEVCTLNGEAPARAVERIMSQGDAWNACSSSSPPHAVGSKGKFDSPPCVACDFIRRRQGLGLDVALQMWLRAVKRDIQITLGVCAPGEAPAGGSGRSLLSLELPEGVVAAPARSTEARSSIVDLSASSSVTGSIAELKSLDEVSGRSGGAKGKGKGKKGKGKGKDEEDGEKKEGEEGEKKEGEEEKSAPSSVAAAQREARDSRFSPIASAQREARLRFEKDILDRIQGRWGDEADPNITYVVEGSICSVSSGDGGRGFRNRLSVYGVEFCWDARRFWHYLNLPELYSQGEIAEKLEWNPAKDSPPTTQIVWNRLPPLPEVEEAKEGEGEKKEEKAEEKEAEEKPAEGALAEAAPEASA